MLPFNPSAVNYVIFTKWNLLLKLLLLNYLSGSHLPFRKNTSCQPYLPHLLPLRNYFVSSLLHSSQHASCSTWKHVTYLANGVSFKISSGVVPQVLGVFPKTPPAPNLFISWSHLVPISHSTLSSHFLVMLCSFLALDFCTSFSYCLTLSSIPLSKTTHFSKFNLKSVFSVTPPYFERTELTSSLFKLALNLCTHLSYRPSHTLWWFVYLIPGLWAPTSSSSLNPTT